MCEDSRAKVVKNMMEEINGLHKGCYKLMSIAIKKHNVDLSPEQSKLLFLMYHDEFSSQQTLAKHLGIAPATLSVRIQRLETAGYLRREVDTNDKRNYILKLEPKGKELVTLTHTITDQIVKRIFDDFSDEEMQQLIYFINKLKNNVGNIKEEM